MAKDNNQRARTELLVKFILNNVESYPDSIVALTVKEFSISRQAVLKHIKKLADEKLITVDGNTKARTYKLNIKKLYSKTFPVSKELNENSIWTQETSSFFSNLEPNVYDIWHYGFTEMFNNVIDHSNATTVVVDIEDHHTSKLINIYDNGVGIFEKIQEAMGLSDPRHSVLELAKGKFTTDKDNHSGEGIFFTSRLFSSFQILSKEVYFTHIANSSSDLILEANQTNGTLVILKMSNDSDIEMDDIFAKFASSKNDYGFTKTIVPVKMAQYGDDMLVSRSQAKRLLARIDRFKTVVFDFEGVEKVGQAFADQIFRVFKNSNPEVELLYSNASTQIQQMIKRVEFV